MWGSYLCALINLIALMAQFYTALYPVDGTNLDPTTFFQAYLAGPLFIFLYIMWKVWSWFKHPEDRPLYVKIKDIDIYTGMRDTQSLVSGPGVDEHARRSSIAEWQAEDAARKKGVKGKIMSIVHSVI